ncbi:CpsD/CapB family tyrosine-protein kinase [Heyndrickxia ginsengihumi]|uniref:CpsD/CapB family tyrosine-protein kinase n=1 Tax=Heyndrickxia ginsengihumi TaxID=363870 RepID=UPI003D1F2ACF
MAPKKQKLLNAKRKLITKLNPKSPISEQFRTIRTNINFSSVDKEMRLLMVTSSSPGEGKSTVAANLAVTFAQQGKKVLLVDADLRKPTVHYTFNMTNTFGLTTILTRQGSFQESISSTDVQHLYVLPSGPIPPNPAELLGSRGMKELLREATAQYDIVLLDTPPVLAVTDAQILANECDGTVLVVSSGQTEIDAAKKAKEMLTSSTTPLLGVVLNNKKAKHAQHYYYYYGK